MERVKSASNGLKMVSLFSGIGGMDLGFKYAGFDIVFANDFDRYAVETYKANVDKNIVLGDINECLDLIPNHDILIGGFPCQPFSMMGEQKGFDDSEERRISNIRRLTPNECRKLQGFPDDWEPVVSDTQQYRQFGNAVTVDVAYYLAVEIANSLRGKDSD